MCWLPYGRLTGTWAGLGFRIVGKVARSNTMGDQAARRDVVRNQTDSSWSFGLDLMGKPVQVTVKYNSRP